ncbi:MAG: hypothetical protein ABIP88_13305 [Candidatus Binatia bacterium]
MSGLKFVIRRPRFPIICQIGAELVAGDNLQQFERRLKKMDLTTEDTFSIVDARGEGWALHRDLSAVSPLTIDKNWTKARVIEMFNSSANAQRAGLQYPQRSLANRRLDAVIRDVAELLDQAERTVPRQAGNATGA